jgi:hypothetical protein
MSQTNQKKGKYLEQVPKMKKFKSKTFSEKREPIHRTRKVNLSQKKIASEP